MAPSNNRAAWLKREKAATLAVEEAPYWEPGADEIVVKTTAVAINPVDWGRQARGILIKSYPTILGNDITGEIVSIGSAVSEFKVGDRVFGDSMSIATGDPKYGAFQEYPVMKPPRIAKVPSNITNAEAAVLPLGLDTAAACLFPKDKLGLAMPPSSAGGGKTLIIWGGSSSVGACAIQLAVAAGYAVVAVASERNHEFCKSLGASQVFHYDDDSAITERMVAALKDAHVVGALDAIGRTDVLQTLSETLVKSGGERLIICVYPGLEKNGSEGVEVRTVIASTTAYSDVGPHIWGKFITPALESARFQCKPDPMVVGHGLEAIQAAMNTQKEGVSAKKIVVTL